MGDREFRSLIAKHFDIARYAGASKLRADGWYKALSLRCSVEDSVSSGRAEFAGIHLETFFELLLDMPLNGLDERENDRIAIPAVTDLSVLEAWGFREIIDEMMPEDAAACRKEDAIMDGDCEDDNLSPRVKWIAQRLRVADECGSIPALPPEQTACPEDDSLPQSVIARNALLSASLNDRMIENNILINESNRRFVEVDLCGSDEIILEGFSRWLAAQRNKTAVEQSRIRKFTEADFREWAQKRVLAYLDLSQLAKCFGVRLPLHRLGSLLFPDMPEIDVAERVRKVVVPTAKYLMHDDTLQALQIEANDRRAWSAEEKR